MRRFFSTFVLVAVNGGAMAPTVKPEGLLVLLVMTQTAP